MSFGNLFSVISSFVSAQIAPTTTSFFNGLWDLIGNAFTWLGNAIASLFYVVCKWFLAFVDFLQYFIQKLIGLDYWLNNNTYTLEGATGNDLLFSFLYDETVQRVFRAMLGVFVVLLIIFTIYQIIKNEWTYITGESFGDGKSNSKAKILRQALKAIAIVILFPIMLFVGIISSNAILASLVKALNIDMASTFGGSIFSISAQNANRYRQYAAADARNAVSDEVSFYITRDGKYLVLTNGRTGSDEFCEYVNTYEDYLNKAGSSTKYTVNTMFGQVNPNDPFYGYCVSLNINGETVYYMLPCLDYGSTGTVNSPTAMYYYLRNVLQVNIMNRNNNIGNQDILNDIRGYMQNGTSQNGFIRNADFSQFTNGSEVIKACYNSWSYGTIYSNSRSFSESLSFSGLLNGQGSFLSALGIDSVQSAKLMFNNDTVATYFDGGQLGVVQLKAEYQVMADVMDFILENGVTLYMLDISSNMINWTYDSNYQVETRWVSSGTLSGNVNNAYYDAADGNTYLPFVVSYSEECDDAETGNVLYMANANGNNELHGSKYIMCWKVNVGTSTEYIPLVNNMTYTNPETRNTYRFSSDYLASNYRGVVLAKGAFDFSVNSTNAMGGMPTYIKSSQNLTNNEGEVISQIDRNTPYYYNMSVESGFTQFVDEEGLNGNNTTNYEAYTIDGFGIEDSGEGDSLDAGSSYSVSPISGNNRRFQIIKDSDPVTLNDALMQRLTVNLIYTSSGGNRNIVASFGDDNLALPNGANRYLLFEVSNNGYYFIIRYNTTDNYFTVHSVDTTSLATDKQNNSISFDNAGVELGDTLNCAYWNYNIKYTTYEEGKKSEAINKIGADQTIEVNSSYFEYSQESDGGQSLYRTEEIINISSLNKSSYIFAYFNTVNQSLLNLNLNSNKVYINFATADPGGDYSSTFDQKVLRFDLYNFYTYMTSGSSLKVWNDDGTVDPATVPDENDPNYVFKCKINESDFYFATNDNSLGLYDGNEYVATIYKNIGQECATIDDLASVTTRILYDTNSYENVRTRNYYGSDDDAMNHYESLSSQFIIGNCRDNAPVVFWKWDFNLWLFGIRINCALGLPEMNREVVSQSFRVSDGIGYDYFFDNDTYISLSTFYIPLKISYWIILISSVLIIKVLGTAIWGVIKRFYEITLYYLAMPAMASTIPLDDGNRFNQHIIRNLFNKVLGTYGVILGINVFFILLTPVRSLSNIFTAEDIATSGSYFLIHLPFSYKVLNSYVYILFVLVAFTMIDSLPKVISALMGNENGDILTSGQRTKEQVGKDMKSATDMISGRSLIDSTKKAGQTLKDTVPGIAVAGAAAKKVKGAVEWGIQKHQGKKEAEAAAGATADGGSSGGTKSARADDENPDGAPDDSPDGAPDGTPDGGGVPANVTAENSPAMAPVNQAVENRTGVSVADAHASGDNASIAVADAAREEIGGELTDEQAEAIAASDVNRQAINNEEITGGDNAAVVANVVRNNAGNANLARTVAQAVTNSQGSNPINLSELGLDASKLGLDGANITVGKDANGNLEYKATKDGQEVTIPPDVISQITQAILAKLGNGDIKTAAMQSGEMGAVANIFGNNIATGIDFSGNNQSNGVLAEEVYNQALQNENVNADAILRHMIHTDDYDEFARSYHIVGSDGEVVGSDKILEDKDAYAMAIETIKNQYNSRESNEINRLSPSAYSNELGESIKAGIQNGTFSVSAWMTQNNESKNDAVSRVLAGETTYGHSILDGATEAEQTSIIANTAKNVVKSNPNGTLVQEMEASVFAEIATKGDVESMDPEVLKRVTGKGSYEELTDEDKALLGFMSANHGMELKGITDADAIRLKGMYNDANVRAKTFANIIEQDKNGVVNTLKTTGSMNLLARVATLDSSIAMSEEQKDDMRRKLVNGELTNDDSTKISLSDEEKSKLVKKYEIDFESVENKNNLDAIMLKKNINISAMSEKQKDDMRRKLVNGELTNDDGTKISLSDEDKSKLIKKETNEIDFESVENKNYLDAIMKEKNANYSNVVNSHYNLQRRYARTEDELAVEKALSLENVKGATVNAFINSEIEGKSEIVDSIMADYTKDNYSGLINKNKELIQSLSEEGYSESDIQVAIGKINLLGMKIERDSVVGMLQDNGMHDKDVLEKLQVQKNYDLTSAMESRFTSTELKQFNNSLATNGFIGLNGNDQSKLLEQLAGEDGGILEKFENARKENQDLTLNKFIEDNDEIKKELTSRASEMSFYEVNERLSGKSSKDIYDTIQARTKRNKIIDDVVRSNEISSDAVLLQMKSDEAAKKEFAETYAEMFNLVDETESNEIRKQAMLQNKEKLIAQIKLSIGEDKFNEKYADVDLSKDDNFMNILTDEMSENFAVQDMANQFADEAVKETNLRRLANGGIERMNAVASIIKENPSLMKKARTQYVRENEGKELSELSELEQNLYLVKKFESSLDEEDQVKVKNLDEEFENKKKNFKNRDEMYSAIVNRFDENKDEYNLVFERVSENTESDSINRLKKTFAEKRINSLKQSGMSDEEIAQSIQPNLETMTASERKQFSNNRNLIQQRMRAEGSGETLANIFKNTKLLNEESIIQEMLRIQTGNNNLKLSDELSKGKDIEEIKKSLTSETINKYMNSHEKTKDQLLNLGAKDLLLTLDDDTRQERKLDATLYSANLQNEVVNNLYKAKFGDESKEKDNIINEAKTLVDNKLKQFIFNDLKLKNNNPEVTDEILWENINNNFNNYKDENNQEYSLYQEFFKNELSKVSNFENSRDYIMRETLKQSDRFNLRDGETDDDLNKRIEEFMKNNRSEAENLFAKQRFINHDEAGNVLEFNEKYVNDAKEIIKNLENSNNIFKKSLDNAVTKSVTGKHVDENAMNSFFGEVKETSHLKGKLSKEEEKPANVGDAFNNFTKDGFITRGKNAVLFKLTKKLPEQSAAYDNWNRLLENKIKLAESKQGKYATMSDEHRLAEIEKMKSQKIKSQLPKDFAKMTPEEQRIFKEEQTMLKQEALQVKNYGKLYKQETRVTKPKERNAIKKVVDKIGYSTVGGAIARVPVLRAVTGGLVTDTVKLKHKQDMFRANQLVDRFNATAMLRNKDVNFGANFEQFAKGYFSPNQIKSMMKRNKLNSNEEFAKLSGDERNAEIKKREEAFKGELLRLQKVATKKVAQDEHVKPKSYLANKGFASENVRYKDGSHKYTVVQSELGKGNKPIKNLSTRRQVAENELIALRNKNNKLQELNSTYKGDRNGYYQKLTEILGKDVVDKKIVGKNGLDSSGNVNIPKSVLMRNALKFVESSEKQYTKRVSSKGVISASSEAASQFIGKTMTNDKTKREVELDKRRASDLNRDLNIFNTQKELLNFDQLVKKMSPQVISKMKDKKFDGLSDSAKKSELEKLIKKELDQANSKVHNNNLLKSDADKLTKLNGIYLNKRDLNTTGTSGTVINNMRATNSAVYQNLVKNAASANSKYKIEEANLAELSKRLETLRSMPSTRANRSEIRKVTEAMAASRIKLGNLKQVASAAEARKTAYEKSFATTQIKEAKISNRNLGVNVSRSVFERYEFPMRRPGGGPPVMVNPGSMEGKIIDRLIIRFMLRYRNYMERMIKSFKETDKSLYDELNNSYKKLKSEFGSNYRSLKSTQKKLENKLNTIKNKTDKESLDMKTRISDNLTKLKQTETELTGQLKNMGVEIGEVRLKKQ